MIIDGKAMAAEILMRVKERAEKLDQPLKIVAISVNEGAATRSYLKIKERAAREAGCELLVQSYPEKTIAPMLKKAVEHAVDIADAVIVQLPIVAPISAQELCDMLSVAKDPDVLSSAARTKFKAAEPDAIVPPVAAALAEVLKVGGIDPRGKRAVVIGAGQLVGEPCATWLTHAGATVSVVTLESGNLSVLKDADIVVSGAGAPHLIKPEMLKEGVALIDAGTSESGGKIVGDADPACAPRCSIFTPVPGGVGPIAVACLFENAVLLAERKLQK